MELDKNIEFLDSLSSNLSDQNEIESLELIKSKLSEFINIAPNQGGPRCDQCANYDIKNLKYTEKCTPCKWFVADLFIPNKI